MTLGGGNAPKTGGMDRRDPRVVVKTACLRDDNLRNYHTRLEVVRQQPCHQSYPSTGWYPDRETAITQQTKGRIQWTTIIAIDLGQLYWKI
jgi:hypothetical protein